MPTPGSITFDASPGDVPAARPSTGVAVFRYDPDAGEDARFVLLPHVRCLAIQIAEGPDPPTARFRYVFLDDSLAGGFPNRIEEVLGFSSASPFVLPQDSRVCVRTYYDDGSSKLRFDGFVGIPQADLDGDTEVVSFVAVGTPTRERDKKVSGATYRDANNASVADEAFQVDTALPARFNPDGKPNATGDDSRSGEIPLTYPVFIGPVWPANRIGGRDINRWTLPRAVRYLIGRWSSVVWGGTTYVTQDDPSYLDDLLRAIVPSDADGVGVIDLTDSTTYKFEDIEVDDIDVVGYAWPDAVYRMIKPHGFTFRWDLGEDENGAPVWTWLVYRTDLVDGLTKTLKLQKAGNYLDPGETNLGRLGLQRDTHGIANQIVVDSKPDLVEASFVLAPGFEVAAADLTLWAADNADPAAEKHFTTNGTLFAGGYINKYRRFVFDECGEGHWDFTAVATSILPGDTAPALNPDGKDPKPFVVRRRPGRGPLITLDASGRPLQPRLDVSFNYAGGTPGVWDRSGKWYTVGGGQWRMLEDRLGIYITAIDCNSFSAGTWAAPPAACPDGKMKLIEYLTTTSFPTFRLTCVVEADRGIVREGDIGPGMVAPRRAASPTGFPIEGRVDARDRFGRSVVSRYSVSSVEGTTDELIRDDTDEAAALANGVRRAREAGEFNGSAVIPRFTPTYRLGDRIRAVDGRGLDLRQNAGAPAGETAVYPSVISVTWNFDGEQSTTLELGDTRSEPAPRRQQRPEKPVT